MITRQTLLNEKEINELSPRMREKYLNSNNYNKWKISSLIPDTECPDVKVLGYGKPGVNLERVS